MRAVLARLSVFVLVAMAMPGGTATPVAAAKATRIVETVDGGGFWWSIAELYAFP